MKNKKICNIGLLFIFMIAFYWLFVEEIAHAEEQPKSVKKSNTIYLKIKWLHQFQFAGYYAAIEKGFYRDVGLNVKIIEALGPTESIDYSGLACQDRI